MATKGDISGLDVLQFGGVPMVPLIEGYSGARQSGVIQSNAAGGSIRQRKKFYNTTFIYQVSFYLENKFEQDYIKFFFNQNEGKKFICHLAADRPLVEPYVVQVIGDVSDDNRNALYGKVSMTMEIYSTSDKCLDEIMTDLYSCYGKSSCEIINQLNALEELFITC